jgi:redox-sensing transcriptional repressor
VRRERTSLAVLATPADVAQAVCDRLVAAGVTGVLTFVPRVLQVPDEVDLRSVDLATELQILAFHARRRTLDG